MNLHFFKCPGWGLTRGAGQQYRRGSGRGHAGPVNHFSLRLRGRATVRADWSSGEGHVRQS